MAVEVPLTLGYVALVDDADGELMLAWRWSASIQKDGRVYAIANDMNWKTVRMHRVLLNAPKGVLVDHRDGNGLNNQRANLRLCSASENARNRRIQRRKTIPFKGVAKVSRGPNFFAHIRIDGRNCYLGVYPTPEGAARAYDCAALEAFGEFASLNFPKDAAA